MYNTHTCEYTWRDRTVYFSVRMPICLQACVRVFRHECLPAYVPACLGACRNVCMNGSTRAEIDAINGLFTSVSVSSG